MFSNFFLTLSISACMRYLLAQHFHIFAHRNHWSFEPITWTVNVMWLITVKWWHYITRESFILKILMLCSQMSVEISRTRARESFGPALIITRSQGRHSSVSTVYSFDLLWFRKTPDIEKNKQFSLNDTIFV